MKRRHMHILISFSLAGQLNSLAAVFEQVPYMFTSQFGDGLAGRKNLDGGGRGVGRGGRGGGWGRGEGGGLDSNRIYNSWIILRVDHFNNRVNLSLDGIGGTASESKYSSRLVHPIDVFLIKY